MLGLAHQHLLILGLGDSGLAMARWAVFCGANVWVADTRGEPPQLHTLRQELPQVQFVHASLGPELLALASFDGVYKSPGLSPQSVAPLWLEAQAQGLKVGNELSLFAQALNDLKTHGHYRPDVLVVTGTNGKTTVTSLCAHMLQKAKKRVAVAGNIGPTLLGTLLSHLSVEDLESLREFKDEQNQQKTDETADLADLKALSTQVEPSPISRSDLDEQSEPAEHGENSEHGEHGEQNGLTIGQALHDEDDHTAVEAPLGGEGHLEVSGEAGLNEEELLPLSAPQDAPELEQHVWQSAQALPEVWVLEISSFQAFGVTEFEPTAAVILNITEDHLDWHQDMQEYRAAKVGLFAAHTLRVINRDDPEMAALRPALSAKSLQQKPKSAMARAAREALPRWVEYGAQAPERAGDFGIERSAGMVWLVRAKEAEVGVKPSALDLEPLPIQRLMPLDALKIRGPHNALNAMAALTLACTTGAHMAPLLHALKDYGGEAHRIQTVRVLDGVQYVDDSKGTNVGATCAALNALGQEGPVVVILGGVGKGQDFSPLSNTVAQYAKAVILIGEDAPKIKEVLAPLGKTMVQADSLQQAVCVAQELARSGDLVLLSPACASFDMFKDYAHRAQVFQEAVNHLVPLDLQSLQSLQPLQSIQTVDQDSNPSAKADPLQAMVPMAGGSL